MNKWVQKWDVSGSNGNTWRVAVDKNGNYGCSCPIWKFKRRECHHIQYVKNNNGKLLDKLPEIFYGQVHQVKKEGDRVLIPLIPVGDTHFSASIAYVLRKMGYSISVIKHYVEVAKNNSMKAIEEYVEGNGIKIWDKETFYLPNALTEYILRGDKIKKRIIPVSEYKLYEDN